METDPPAATIALDEGVTTQAPHTFKGVEAGTHRITASLEGYLPAQQELQLDGKTASKIALKLEKQPPPAETPQPSPPTETPQLSLPAETPRFDTQWLPMLSLPAETPRLSPPPEQFGTLSVTTNPPGASLLLDGNPPDEPPNTFTGIRFGKHRLTAKLEGLEPIYEELEINTAETLHKSFELQRTQESLRLQELVDQVREVR